MKFDRGEFLQPAKETIKKHSKNTQTFREGIARIFHRVFRFEISTNWMTAKGKLRLHSFKFLEKRPPEQQFGDNITGMTRVKNINQITVTAALLPSLPLV